MAPRQTRPWHAQEQQVDGDRAARVMSVPMLRSQSREGCTGDRGSTSFLPRGGAEFAEPAPAHRSAPPESAPRTPESPESEPQFTPPDEGWSSMRFHPPPARRAPSPVRMEIHPIFERPRRSTALAEREGGHYRCSNGTPRGASPRSGDRASGARSVHGTEAQGTPRRTKDHPCRNPGHDRPPTTRLRRSQRPLIPSAPRPAASLRPRARSGGEVKRGSGLSPEGVPW